MVPWLEPHDFGPGSNVTYHLSGVISHSGVSIHSGHYVSYIRSGHNWDQWSEVNDAKVTRCVLSDFDDSKSHRIQEELYRARMTPYIVMYELDHSKSNTTPGRSLMNPRQGLDSDMQPFTWLPGTREEIREHTLE